MLAHIKNKIILSGKVCKNPDRKLSPYGIAHCQFIIEHKSKQIEANLFRQAWCKIIVMISGNNHEAINYDLTIGTELIVQGFINTHKARYGFNKIVLHAEKIILIDFRGKNDTLF